MSNIESKEENLNFLNLLIIILSFYVLGYLIVDTFFTLPLEITKVLGYVDNFICIVFSLILSYDIEKQKTK